MNGYSIKEARFLKVHFSFQMELIYTIHRYRCWQNVQFLVHDSSCCSPSLLEPGLSKFCCHILAEAAQSSLSYPVRIYEKRLRGLEGAELFSLAKPYHTEVTSQASHYCIYFHFKYSGELHFFDPTVVAFTATTQGRIIVTHSVGANKVEFEQLLPKNLYLTEPNPERMLSRLLQL